ncbi:uncharacterized protein ASPGLDRAFT_57501 [Aspergillus glaucus CBS 516.65]|uniref:Uncharacterized protein n=1 Tax=Aspergillus glaucus CBS 516.65 TaxID=1160497 RepID=A0A1L9VKS4_ASPGL|nr:hypothetical protein ASPGLDRAFT_57501 [Aspergillus glaucus CBS 516.65]OJJ84491.1 hypothetical protein ASPGLDRAFT_57501 [Aspergillus glaucus CBS 516.65]
MSVNRTISKDSTITISPDSLPPKQGGVNGARRLIAWAAFVTIVPLLLVVGVIVYILIHYHVPRKADAKPTLRLPSDQDDPSVFLVDIDSARFVTISSVASTVVALLPGFIMILCSFRLAKKLSDTMQEDRIAQLPTPYQFGLLIEVMNSQLVSLWDLICYSRWKKIALSPVLRMAVGSLVVSLLLSYAIWVADTWLHIVTEATVISQVTPMDTPNHSLGFDFFSECAGVHDDTKQLPDICVRLIYAVVDRSAQPYLVVNNLSDTYQVRQEALNDKAFSYLAPASSPANIDYQAHTLAASSHCEPYTQQCNVHTLNETTSIFNCSDNFHGTMTEGDALKGTACSSEGCMKLFTDADLNHTANMNTATPFYAGVIGNFHPTQVTLDSTLTNDSQVIVNKNQWVFMLRCAVRVQDLTYSFVNGSMTAAELSPANDDVRAMSSRFPRLDTVLIELGNMLQVATAVSNTSQEIADYYSTSLEALTIASTANFFKPSRCLKEQLRETVLVTRVPKIPLFLLGSLCLLFVALSMALTGTVMLERPTRYRDIQARLSVFGLAASRFEAGAGRRVSDMEDLFGEKRVGSSRVGITMTPDGGWDYFSEV